MRSSTLGWMVGSLALGAAVVGAVLWRRTAASRERLPGGLAPGGRCPVGVDLRELQKGVIVEREHTRDVAVAREIACDHLTEDPRYYTKLALIER